MRASPIGRDRIVKLHQKIRDSYLAGLLSVSIGIILASTAGGWDITNHLLNKPESFFSPPHAALYSGVSLVIVGGVLIHISRSDFRQQERQIRRTVLNANYVSRLPLSIKLIFLGIALLVSAGPFDYAWHSSFGLDGLLSPPHAILTAGMAFGSIGALIGILSINRGLKYGYKSDGTDYEISKIRKLGANNFTAPSNLMKKEIHHAKPYNKAAHPILIIIGILPVWLTVSGLIHMATLPFSDTPYFNFNPNPIVAVVIATIFFPFLVSFILFSSFRLCIDQGCGSIGGPKSMKNNKFIPFGIISLIGITFIVVNILTSILPNEYLTPTLPFYIMNVLPLVGTDLLLSKGSIITEQNHVSVNKRENNVINYLAGSILGLSFFTLYFPLITHTYNEALPNAGPVWPSLTSLIYFKIIQGMGLFAIVPAMIMGVFGVAMSSNILGLQQRRKAMIQN
ncbi:MAG: hypothetical protein M3297_11295 [Thermoproteota archaeon]|nr:hypothetical protein [Thermoproteota archaeon]